MAQREAEIAGFDVVSNPEFLREGSAVYDTFNPDRIVLGSNSEKAIAMMQELYQPLVTRKFAEDKSLPPVPVVVTDLNSAEMIKYAANSFLATKISFINEVANICITTKLHNYQVRFFSSKFHRRFINNCETNNNKKISTRA